MKTRTISAHGKRVRVQQFLDVCVREPIVDPVLDVCVREPIMDPVLDVCVREPIVDLYAECCRQRTSTSHTAWVQVSQLSQVAQPAYDAIDLGVGEGPAVATSQPSRLGP